MNRGEFRNVTHGMAQPLPIGSRPSTWYRSTATAEQGYLHCGSNGAGHFVKMVHNGIEYGIMAAYAEGMGVLRSANIGKHQHEIDAETTPLRDPQQYQYDMNLSDIAEVWQPSGATLR